MILAETEHVVVPIYIKRYKNRIANTRKFHNYQNIKIEMQRLRVQTTFFAFFRGFPSPLSP
jgi:hypothetical protein